MSEKQLLVKKDTDIFLNGTVCTFHTKAIREEIETLMAVESPTLLTDGYYHEIIQSSFYGEVALIKSNPSEKVQTIEEMAKTYREAFKEYFDDMELDIKESDYIEGATAQKAISDKQAEEREREWKEKIVDVFNWLTCIDWNGSDRDRYFALLKTKYNIQDGI